MHNMLRLILGRADIPRPGDAADRIPLVALLHQSI